MNTTFDEKKNPGAGTFKIPLQDCRREEIIGTIKTNAIEQLGRSKF